MLRLVVLECPVSPELWRQRKSGKSLSCFKVELTQSWLRRWSSILACAGARAFALSLLDRGCSAGVDGPTPFMHEVLGDSRQFL